MSWEKSRKDFLILTKKCPFFFSSDDLMVTTHTYTKNPELRHITLKKRGGKQRGEIIEYHQIKTKDRNTKEKKQ